MLNNNERIIQLQQQLNNLAKKQESFSKEINDIQNELNSLKHTEENKPPPISNQAITFDSISEARDETPPVKEFVDESSSVKKNTFNPPVKRKSNFTSSNLFKGNLEKFIGESLISKLGIAITIIGVAIGAKYAIDNELISPLTRIILGYLIGLGLLGFAIKLKKNYKNFSAVLLSGSLTIMYSITFFAYSYYNLIPQMLAFALMVVLTVFTVIAAINYNKQIIAHIGLIGAYAVPFLLSDGSGRVLILFSYMAIINIGILAIAFKKSWDSLFYVSFGLTWLIYLAWYFPSYEIETHFNLALIFISVFFATFYLTFLLYSFGLKEKFKRNDVLLMLLNSFVFYGLGYSILSDHEVGKELLGLFTVLNGVIHFCVSVIVYKKDFGTKELFFLLSGLVLLFITIAIPVQLDGEWVTLLWAFESALLFWIGRTKNFPVYEKLSYPLMALAFLSIVQDWSIVYSGYNPDFPETKIIPLLNINFLTSLLLIAAFSFINFVFHNSKYNSPFKKEKEVYKLLSFVIPAILVVIVYFSFMMELTTYWNQLYADSKMVLNTAGQEYPTYYFNYDIRIFQSVWVINYSLLFLTIFSFINIYKIKNGFLGILNLLFNTFAVIIFLTVCLYQLSELRDSYLSQTLSEYYNRGVFNVIIRYISLAFIGSMLVTIYNYTRQEFLKYKLKIPTEIMIYVSVLWIASSELIHWMHIGGSTELYKLGLSILWGVYSLVLIIIGIWKKKQHLRVGAIVLFAVTLLKLFFYDIAHLDTISKTILFISLGVLLLVISFLYNKYRAIIFNENEN